MLYPCPNMAINPTFFVPLDIPQCQSLSNASMLCTHTHFSAFTRLMHLSAHLVLIFPRESTVKSDVDLCFVGFDADQQILHPNHPLFSQLVHPPPPPHPTTLLSGNLRLVAPTLHLPTLTSLAHRSLARALPSCPMKLLLLISVIFSVLIFSVMISILPLLIISKPSQTGILIVADQ